jgi:hypothetical protein
MYSVAYSAAYLTCGVPCFAANSGASLGTYSGTCFEGFHGAYATDSGVDCVAGFVNGDVPHSEPVPLQLLAQVATVADPEAYEAEEERGHRQLPVLLPEPGQTPASWAVPDLDRAGE